MHYYTDNNSLLQFFIDIKNYIQIKKADFQHARYSRVYIKLTNVQTRISYLNSLSRDVNVNYQTAIFKGHLCRELIDLKKKEEAYQKQLNNLNRKYNYV